MSGRGMLDASTVEGMIEITERLTDLLADQARAFERHRPQDAAASMSKVAQLTGLYRAGSARMQALPAAAMASPLATRQRLIRATEAFEAVLERQTLGDRRLQDRHRGPGPRHRRGHRRPPRLQRRLRPGRRPQGPGHRDHPRPAGVRPLAAKPEASVAA